MEELILEINLPSLSNADLSDVDSLVEMAKNRASRGAKLPLVTIVVRGKVAPRKVFELRKYVTHVEYRVDDEPPSWFDVPGEDGSETSRIRK